MNRLGFMLITMMVFCLSSCKSGQTMTAYIPVETVKTQVEETTKLRIDTVLQTDTKFVYINGDTTVIFRDRWRVRTKETHDTVYIERTDSVAVPYPVEKQLTRWQQTKVDYGGSALLVLATVICAAVGWLVRKFRR